MGTLWYNVPTTTDMLPHCVNSRELGTSKRRFDMHPQCTTSSVTCLHCNLPFHVMPSMIANGGGKFCSQKCYHAHRKGSLADRFWGKVQLPTDTNLCWEWRASTDTNGYGQINAGGPGGKPLRAHRVSWELAHGPIPEGLCVLHRCDNPLRVNPQHLWLGTQTDNLLDCKAKGRLATGDRSGIRTHPESVRRGDASFPRQHPERMAHGSAHVRAKLIEDAVCKIKRRHREEHVTMKDLAIEYSIDRSCISRIISGLAWKHVQ